MPGFEISVCKSRLMTDPIYHVATLFYITYTHFGSADSQLKAVPLILSMHKTTLALGQLLRSVDMEKRYLGKEGYPVLYNR